MTQCILTKYRTDKCASCTHLCPHRIALEGMDGKSGRIGNSGLPKDYRGITLDNSPAREAQAEIYRMLCGYIKTFRRYRTGDSKRIKSLYLWSESPGTGKTTTASALLNEWIAQDYLGALKNGEQPSQTPAIFFDANEFQTRYNLATMSNDDAELERIGSDIKRAQIAPFVVFDDVGIRSSTEAFKSYIHAIINHRTANGMPTVYTSNLPLEDMATVFDARLYDRMRDQCVEVAFTGESNRGKR